MTTYQHVSTQNFLTPYAEKDSSYLQSLSLSLLQNAVEEQVERCMQHAKTFFPTLPSPSVWFDLRGKSAGQAHFGRKGLRFNIILLQQHPLIFLNQVVPHEVAHWVVQYGISPRVAPHGKEWRYMMTHLFGIPADVTHRMDVSRASPSPFLYQCQCRDEHGQLVMHAFTTRRHNMVGKGRRYVCKRCRSELVFYKHAPAP
ncbi:Protein SprT [Halomonadaceae bacterium LMG 33818]|uniref:SprT family zinc-dependent metalloprotease n=1 Tax=Cernens ardua TaxID=3402176 RepID=UPI003EDBE3FE